eukprot:TCONS_00020262-protein
MGRQTEEMIFITFLLLVPIFHSSKADKVIAHEKPCHQKTVVFAFSGLRWDVEKLASMRSLERMKTHGVWAKHKINAFQTESLPSFMTMSTGRYPNEHGIMSNKMRNVKGDHFDVKTTSTKWYGEDLEPIWLRNQNQNGSSALCYWPGYGVDGLKPDYSCHGKNFVDPFKELISNNEIVKEVMPFQQRVNLVKKWLTNTTTSAPSFIGVYFEEPYKSMIASGIHSNETKHALKKIDSFITHMLDWLKAKKLNEKVNFVVTGESGATEIAAHKEIFLSDLLENDSNSKYKNKFEVLSKSPIMSIYPKDKTVEKALLHTWKKNKQMTVLAANDIPHNFHYKHKTRNAPITLVAKEHWRIYKNRIVDSKRALMGFDGKFESSHAMFLAQGPAFKENTVIPAIGNVDVYAILCRSIGISPGAHSGNITNVEKLMRPPEQWYEKVVKKIVKKITESPKNFIIAVVITVLLFFGATFLIITAVYKACGCCRIPMKVKVPASKKLIMMKKRKKDGDEHLLSEKELSDSDLSSSDEFYFTNQGR